MPTVAAKTPARKAPVRRSATTRAPRHLAPPSGPSAREAMADYPAPSPEFNVAAVESLIASRARR